MVPEVQQSSKVNNEIYNHYGDRWYTAFDDPVALLRAESRTKIPWVLEKLYASGLPFGSALLDVGCGAGFMSNAFAVEGFQITGVDLSEESLEVAKRYDSTKTVRYLKADALQLPFQDGQFDAVIAMDFLEHVDAPEKVILEISRVLRPGGLFFFHTFNRNWLSHLVVIKLVEKFVKNTPPNMHVIELFLKPQEVRQACQRAGLQTREIVGLRPVLSSIPLKNYRSGVVPPGLRFKITKSTWLSYLGYAIKENI